jgi:hypothetical protein
MNATNTAVTTVFNLGLINISHADIIHGAKQFLFSSILEINSAMNHRRFLDSSAPKQNKLQQNLSPMFLHQIINNISKKMKIILEYSPQ